MGARSALRNKRAKIGVDLMGGDHSPSVLIDALSSISEKVELVLIGTPECDDGSVQFVPASSYIAMDESPLAALRRKKDASVCVGLRLLKSGKIDGFVSSANTGALVAASKMILGMIPGVRRPALLALLPTKKNPVIVLDVGANIAVKASHLVQFAQLGAAHAKERGIKRPRVGLLNIGSEPIKGTSELRLAHQKLSKSPPDAFQFVGNVEGKSVFEGEVDVLVTDGFTGNIFLKTSEGVASLILGQFHSALSSEDFEKLKLKLKSVERQLQSAQSPGAIVAGVGGLVVKCHGYASPETFRSAVLAAADLL